MQRRALLKTIAALVATASAGVSAGPARPRTLHVGVIGAGIIGSSVALHLAEAGARVTLFEKLAPTRGATQNSFGFVNIFELDHAYQQLRLQSYLAYRRLDAPLALGVTWGGYINWGATKAEGDAVRALAATLDGSPYAVERIDAAALRRLSPVIEPGPGLLEAAFHSPHAGHIDPVRVTERLIGRARALGVQVRYPCEVHALEMRGGGLAGVLTAGGVVPLDRLVVAAGVDSPALLAPLGYALPLRHAPGILAHSVPRPPLTRFVYDAPEELEFKQMADGRIVGELHFEPPDIPAHRLIRERAIDFPDEALRHEHGQRILERIATVMPGSRGVVLERLTLGLRPMPADGFPIVGPVPGASDVYVAVTHSGITLAPILGRYVAQEIVAERPVAALAAYRPERFKRS